MFGGVTNIQSSTANGVKLAYSYDLLGRITNVLANGSAAAAYGFDAVGNLQNLRYGNGVTNLYQYDPRNRLTNLVWKLNRNPLGAFAYTVGPTGNRTASSETVGSTSTRSYNWSYDYLYRLTSESIQNIGTVNYGFDATGNRTNRTSNISGIGNQAFAYTANDWLANDQYDNNGNTTNSTGNSYQYDVLNRLTNAFIGGVSIKITYDGDGNRVKKTVNGVTTYYLVDDKTPNGYAQVLEEYTGSSLGRVYNYGLALISQQQFDPVSHLPSSISYYGTDGHGSTRFLLDAAGGISDTYFYDAYGLLIANSGTTANCYLYCGQQWDTDLGIYYLRARYYKPDYGRFWTMDSFEGNNEDPLSLHKYLYCQDSPIDIEDPTGNYSSWEQFLGYEAQDAIIDNYKDTHPWINRADILSDARIPVKSRKFTYLKPDIINKATHQWLEIKPLSPCGIIAGVAKYKLDSKLLKGYSPDAGWTPTLELETETGESIFVVNCGGVVYWVDKDLIIDATGFAAGVTAGMTAKQLLGFVVRYTVSTAVPACTRLAIAGKTFDQARLMQTVGCATLLSVLAGGVL